ncbi:dynein light chain Tctex-type protein 2B-like [Bufo gargarizans]|uniref:dynein light chain Tctex-type protein 2B-like n=1 Tax=Bufo gargarizans TaxID=30331 RepID=UPI001CF4B759|nr:dynein light chain Tctex-type protein 2B-like [Bufo gargarizans]
MTSKTSGKRASVASVRINLDAPDKSALKMPIRSKPSLGNVSISNQASWSLSGLLAAQRMTKNLKERRAQKVALVKKTEIVEPQPPSFASRPPEKVQLSAIRHILEGYLPLRLENTTYDPKKVPLLVKEISEEIKSQVKKVLPARYKTLCVATMGERGQEDIKVVSRCLWDPHADNYAAHVYQNDSLFCVVSVYTVFCE